MTKTKESTERPEGGDHRSKLMTGGILEEEGIFGLSLHLVSQTARFSASVASNALGVVTVLPCSLVGRIMSVDFNVRDVGGGGAKELRKTEMVAPAVVLKIVRSIVPRSILSAFSPALGNRHSSNIFPDKSKEKKYLAQYKSNLNNSPMHAIEAIGTAQNESQDGHLASSSTTHTDSTSSLSTLSENERGTTDEFASQACHNDDDDGYKQFVKMLHANVQQPDLDSCSTASKKSIDVDTTRKLEMIDIAQSYPVTYYLNFSSLLSQAKDEAPSLPLITDHNNNTFYILQNVSSPQPPFRYLLDALVQNALDLTRDDTANFDYSKTTSTCPLWKPEGDTKKILQGIMLHNATNHNHHDESMRLLETTVLKWTGVIKNDNNEGEVRMIKTRGIVDMSPLELKDLLIDCKRGHLVNKNSLGKRDVCFFPCDVGTTTIVENTLKVPFVGGEIHSLSLTHSRLVPNGNGEAGGGYVIVSKSVQRELHPSTKQLPFYSVSVLRPVGGKTDLVNVAQISQVPVPKFLMNKIAFTSAVDFFNNLRSI